MTRFMAERSYSVLSMAIIPEGDFSGHLVADERGLLEMKIPTPRFHING